MKLAVFAFLLMLSPSALAEPKVGERAPHFALRDREGALFDLGRAKQPVVLDFFRTDCKPCRRSLPVLAKLHARRGKQLKVVLVALLEEEEGEERLERFLRATPLPFTVLVDRYGLAAKKYVVRAGSARIPALFVIDARGVLRARLGGETKKELARKLDRICADLGR